MIKINKFQKRQMLKSGFSLIEVLVTIFILSIGLVAISALMAGNIRSSENSKNQIVASQLAQEGIELVRNLRDNNSTFTSDISGNDYRIDYSSSYADFKISAGRNKVLNLDSNKFYTHNSGTATKFYRKIKIDITTDGSKKTATVTSYVTWNGTGIPTTCNIGNKCVSVVSVMPDLN